MEQDDLKRQFNEKFSRIGLSKVSYPNRESGQKEMDDFLKSLSCEELKTLSNSFEPFSMMFTQKALILMEERLDRLERKK